MAITKADLLTYIDTDIAATTTKVTSLMSTGTMNAVDDPVNLLSYTFRLSLLNTTKEWVEANL